MLRGEWGENFFVRQFSFPPVLLFKLMRYEIFHFFYSFFFLTGKSETNVIKTCALHIDEQLKTCDRGDFVEQRCVMIVVFFVIVLFVTLPFFVHVRTRGRTPSETVSPSFVQKGFSLISSLNIKLWVMKVETRSERSNRYESQSTHCFTTPFDLNFFAKHSLFRLPIVAEDFR